MWTKVYLALLAIASLAMAFFTHYSWSWLQSIGAPAAAIAGYNYFAGLAWAFLVISSIILVVSANVVLLKSGFSWAMWTTLGYFTLFILIQYFWLEQAASGTFSPEMLGRTVWLGPFFAVFLCVGAAAVIFIDQLLVVRLKNRIYPEPAIAAIDSEDARPG